MIACALLCVLVAQYACAGTGNGPEFDLLVQSLSERLVWLERKNQEFSGQLLDDRAKIAEMEKHNQELSKQCFEDKTKIEELEKNSKDFAKQRMNDRNKNKNTTVTTKLAFWLVRHMLTILETNFTTIQIFYSKRFYLFCLLTNKNDLFSIVLEESKTLSAWINRST